MKEKRVDSIGVLDMAVVSLAIAVTVAFLGCKTPVYTRMEGFQ